MSVQITEPADLDGAAVLALADGASLALAPALLDRIDVRRREVLAALADGPAVYGVTTGMGALSDLRLTDAEQTDHSRRLLLARAVGGPPWLEPAEARALGAVRLRTFLSLDAGVSAGLCTHLADLLAGDLVPSVPRTGSGAAGEILPLAHAWGHLAGVGPLAGRAPAYELGPKEGIALLSGTPTATALALLRGRDAARVLAHAEGAAAGAITVAQVSRDPYDDAVTRGDEVLGSVLARLRTRAGPAVVPRHLQAPVSFRVIGPVLAHLSRSVTALDVVAERSLGTVSDSPAYLPDAEGGPRFVGTAGFHGLELAAAMDTLRAAIVHAAATGAARLHRLLDPAVTGLPAQLSADPGPQAGLTPVHKRVVAAVHDIAGWPASTSSPVETSAGQEDVQSFALEAAERLRLALDALTLTVAAELLAVHQAGLLDPARAVIIAGLTDQLPDDPRDRPWGEDLAALVSRLSGFETPPR